MVDVPAVEATEKVNHVLSPGGVTGLEAAQKVKAAPRLFDKELDNQHEEPLLLAQLAAEQLQRLLLCPSRAFQVLHCSNIR